MSTVTKFGTVMCSDPIKPVSHLNPIASQNLNIFQQLKMNIWNLSNKTANTNRK